MELTISKKSFLRGLARTHGVADRKSSMPILSNILLSAEGKDTLRLAATDLYLGVNATVKAEVKKGGMIAVSARTLFDIVKNLPEGEITWTVGENQAAEIKCGKVRYKIPGMPGEDFPPLPNPGEADFAELDAEVLGGLIAHTQFSMSTDDTRPHLAGALFEGDGKIVRMVTTDGHRLSKAEVKQGDGAAMLNFSMLVPNKGIGELKRLIEDSRADKDGKPTVVGIATSGGQRLLPPRRHPALRQARRRAVPALRQGHPPQKGQKIRMGRNQIIEALRRISLVANDKSGGVRLHVESGQLKITSENPDVGEGSEELDIDYAGDPVNIGFNARYLLDALGCLVSDDVSLEITGELDPGVVKPENEDVDFVGVIMPMRI